MGAVASVRQPSTLRRLTWPQASNVQSSIATTNAIERLNEEFKRRI
jgi:hypothetical protein